MPEDDGRMICDNPTSYQLLKAKHGLRIVGSRAKNYLSGFSAPVSDIMTGIMITLGLIPWAIRAAIHFITWPMAWLLRITFAMPTAWRRAYLYDCNNGPSDSITAETFLLITNFSVIAVISSVIGGMAASHLPCVSWTLAMLGITNFLSVMHELGRYARNKKSESASAVSVLAPVDIVAKESSDVLNTPVASPTVTSYNAQNIIDCDSTPFTPNGWSVEEHQKGGKVSWDAKSVGLYLDEQQKTGRVSGSDLREKLKSMPVLNANVLDYLLANPHLIPEEWKGKYIYFWGTIYRHSDRILCVRCLCWFGDRWYWHCGWLDYDWLSNFPAAVCASLPAAGR